jgi:endo-1,4-beta-xylanase
MTTISLKTAIVTLLRASLATAACLLVSPAAATDLPINTNFDDGEPVWWTYASDGNTQTVEVSTDFRLCSVIDATTNMVEDPITQMPTTTLKKVNPWDHIIGLSDIALGVEQYYHIKFTASFTPADAAADPAATREIRFKTGLGDAPYTDYYLFKAKLTSAPQTFEFTYRNLRDDLVAQAQFQIGGTPGTVCLDDIVVEAVAAPAPITHVTPSLTGAPLKTHSAMVKMGTAVDTPIFLSSPQHNAIVAGEFSAITPANSMKMNNIQPLRGKFDFTDTDALYTFASQNGLEFRGHPLVWHTQAASWLETDALDHDTTLAIMYEHIDALMGRYAGRFPYWDVVNEAIDNIPVDPAMPEGARAWGFRKTIWHDKIGDDFIDLAFQRARAADPATKLLYNDFNIEQMGDPKADRVFELVRSMKERLIPIDAIGFQSHYYVEPNGNTSPGVPNMQAIRDNMARYATIGVDVHITECDFRIGKPIDQSKSDLQTKFFAELLQACIDAPNCSHYTVWGLSDIDSWVPSTFPEYDYAHLFDSQFAAKASYQALTNVFAPYNPDGSLVGSGSGSEGGGCSIQPAQRNVQWLAVFFGMLGLSILARRISRAKSA